jgi:hypothetical protein
MSNNNSSKCWHYEEIVKGALSNCVNCQHWIVSKDRCRDKQLLIDKYAESKAFNTYDHIIRQNKGIEI